MLHFEENFGALAATTATAAAGGAGEGGGGEGGGAGAAAGGADSGPSNGLMQRKSPKWLLLAEDDHALDVEGLLRTLAYFNW